jgi:hypothetical protein
MGVCVHGRDPAAAGFFMFGLRGYRTFFPLGSGYR